LPRRRLPAAGARDRRGKTARRHFSRARGKARHKKGRFALFTENKISCFKNIGQVFAAAMGLPFFAVRLSRPRGRFGRKAAGRILPPAGRGRQRGFCLAARFLG